MNILFMTLLDFDTIEEKGIYTDLLREFRYHGHKLYIISPIERRKKQQTRLIDNGDYQILKLRIGNTQKTNIIEKGISTIMLESQFVKGIKDYFHNIKFDLVLYSTPPITLLKAVEYVKKRDKALTYLLLKDIFPQNAVDLGILKQSGLSRLIYNYFRKKEKKLYRISDSIGCMSKANVKFVLEHNPEISSEKLEICPNSIDPTPVEIMPVDKVNEVRDRYQIPRDKTVFIYGGNLGKPQGIDFIIECLSSNQDKHNVFFLIVGSGTEYNKLSSYIQSTKQTNVRLIPHLPKEEYELLVRCCDVGLIFLDKRFTIPNFPSRLLSYMQASLPVLAATDINTDIGQVIEEGQFGYWCESGDLNKFNEQLQKLCDLKERLQMGMNSRKYLEENYTARHSYEVIMSHFK